MCSIDKDIGSLCGTKILTRNLWHHETGMCTALCSTATNMICCLQPGLCCSVHSEATGQAAARNNTTKLHVLHEANVCLPCALH
jgi:hypothetical protein